MPTAALYTENTQKVEPTKCPKVVGRNGREAQALGPSPGGIR
jgi:hypothetical protein